MIGRKYLHIQNNKKDNLSNKCKFVLKLLNIFKQDLSIPQKNLGIIY